MEKNRKYEVEGRAMRKEALTPTPPKEKLSSHATRGIVTVRWKYVADLAGRGEGEGDRVTDFAAANEAEALIGKTRNPETAAE